MIFSLEFRGSLEYILSEDIQRTNRRVGFGLKDSACRTLGTSFFDEFRHPVHDNGREDLVV